MPPKKEISDATKPNSRNIATSNQTGIFMSGGYMGELKNSTGIQNNAGSNNTTCDGSKYGMLVRSN